MKVTRALSLFGTQCIMWASTRKFVSAAFVQHSTSASSLFLKHTPSSGAMFANFKKTPSNTPAVSTRQTQILYASTLASSERETQNPLDIPAERIILFDGVCNFCNTWVDILLRIDFQKKFKFTPLQSDIGKSLLVSIGKDADDISSVVLVEQLDEKKGDTKFYDKSACVLRVVEELGPIAVVFTKATETIVPKGARDSIYDMVAENRYNFLGKRDECRCSDPKYADRFL